MRAGTMDVQIRFLRIGKIAALCLCLCLLLVQPLPQAAHGEAARDLEVEQLVNELKEGAALWALTVGVSRYEEARINLKFADHDALRIAHLLKAQQGRLFREVFTRVLVNERATREEILKAMSEFLGQAAPGDVVLIFMAGHGLQDRQTGTYYFVPYNANAGNLVYAGLPMPMFEEAVKRLRANVDKLVLWMDTCHAGAMSVSARGVNVGEDLAEALEQASGQYVLSASKAGEESHEREDYKFPEGERAHGAFTYSILQGLTEDARDTSGVVWLGKLFSHVSKQVPRLTDGKQHPYGQIQGTDMPIFVMDHRLLAMLTEPLAELPELAETPAGSIVPTGTQMAPAKKGGSKKWLWLLLGGAAAGGAAAALGGGGGGGAESSPPTGSVEIDVQVP
jgi:hypothetical protein